MSPRKVAIIQSNYIPWVGYFDVIASVDEFIFLDEVQYTHRDWRNRNLIHTPSGDRWLTIPIESSKINRNTPIKNVYTSNSYWIPEHLESIRRNYRKSEYFDILFPQLEGIYVGLTSTNLSEINQTLIRTLSKIMNIKVNFSDSSLYPNSLAQKSDRILEICLAAGASVYVSGPAAKNYLDEGKFADFGVQVEWFTYNYLAYKKLWDDTNTNLSIIDTLLNIGPECLSKIRVN